MSKPRIIVVIECGMIQAILSDQADAIEVYHIDYDAGEVESEGAQGTAMIPQEPFEGRSCAPELAWVSKQDVQTASAERMSELVAVIEKSFEG